MRLLAPAELDDRVPAGGRAVDCRAAAAAATCTTLDPGVNQPAARRPRGRRAGAPPARRAAAAPGAPNLRRAWSVVGGAPPRPRSAMAIGDADRTAGPSSSSGPR